MHTKTIAELISGLRNKDFSSEELTRHYLDRIKRLDPTYNSYISVTEDIALTQAQAADARLAQCACLCILPTRTFFYQRGSTSRLENAG